MLEQEKISRIKVLLKSHPKGLTITDIATKLKLNRNSAAKYLEILTISGQVESKTYGMARVFFLAHRLPISDLASIASYHIVTLDQHNRINFANKGFCNLLSVQIDDIAGHHIIDIFRPGTGCDNLPEVFSDVLADQEKIHEVCIQKDAGQLFFKITSMKTVFDDGSHGTTIIMEDVTREKKAQIELAAKEARYRGIVEDQTEFITRFSPDRALTFVNASYARYLGKKAEDLLGQPFIVGLADEDTETVDHALASLSRESSAITFECRVACPSGQRWQVWTVRAFFDGGEKPAEYQGVGRDNTEKREAAAKINAYIRDIEFFSAKLQEFIELPPGADIYQAIGDGFTGIFPHATVVVHTFDPERSTLTLRAVCPEHEREVITGILGQNVTGLEVPVTDASYRSNLQSGKIFGRQGDLYTIINRQAKLAAFSSGTGMAETLCRTIEEGLDLGNYYSAGLTWRGVLLGSVTFSLGKGAILENTSLAETYLQAASIAIQRSLTEAALAESEQLYRSVLDNIQDVYYRSDIEGNLLMASPSGKELLGYPPSYPITGINIARDLYLDPGKRNELVERILAQGSVSNYEIVLKRRDGTPLYIETNSHLLRSRDGTIVGLEGILRDVTERKKAAVRIQEYVGEMEFLSGKLQEFISMDPSENIYQRIADDLGTLVPGAVIAISSYDPVTENMTVEAMVMDERQRDAYERILGRPPVGSRFPVNDPGITQIRTGVLHNPGLPLFDMLFRAVPEPLCRNLQQEISLEDNYAVGFVRAGEVLGAAVIFLPHGTTVSNPVLVEMYAKTASIALQRHLAEEAWYRTDDVYQNVTKFSPFPIMIVGPDFRYRYVNESFTRLFGYTLDDFSTVEEWLTLAFPDPVYRNEMIAFSRSEQTRFRPGYSFTKLCRTRCRDSTIRDIIVRTVVLSDMDVCMVCEDITDRIKAGQADRLLASIIQSSADAIIGKDSSGTILSWNSSAERMYGYTAGEMIGQHISRIIPPDRTTETEDILRQIGQGISVGPLETQRVRKDGRLIDVSVTISPIMDDTGTIIGASTIARDISSHKAEERLRESEEQYRSLVENISVGMYRSTGDPAGHFVWGNSSLVNILGYPSLDDLRKVDIAGIFAETGGRRRLLDDLKRDGFVKNREIALKRPDGSTVPVLVTALARFDTAGGLACINGIVEDISSQRQAEERVKVMVREVQEIVSLIPKPIVVVDHTNTVVAWNAAMAQMTGVPADQVMGKVGVDHLLPYHTPSRPAVFSLLDAPADVLEQYYPGAFRDGASIVARVEKPKTRKQPSRTFLVRASPLSGEDGMRQGALEIINDAGDPGGTIRELFPESRVPANGEPGQDTPD